MRGLDDIDRETLRTLTENGRRSYSDIAEQVRDRLADTESVEYLFLTADSTRTPCPGDPELAPDCVECGEASPTTANTNDSTGISTTFFSCRDALTERYERLSEGV